MGAHKDKTESTEEQEAIESLRKDGYSEVVIDHWLDPRNLGEMKYYDGYSRRVTSPCGDSMWVWLRVRDRVIRDAAYLSDICIGAVSSGSMLTEMVKGRRITEALRISPDDILRALGGLLQSYVHCATLADTASKAAIRDYTAYKITPWKRLYEQKDKMIHLLGHTP